MWTVASAYKAETPETAFTVDVLKHTEANAPLRKLWYVSLSRNFHRGFAAAAALSTWPGCPTQTGSVCFLLEKAGGSATRLGTAMWG